VGVIGVGLCLLVRCRHIIRSGGWGLIGVLRGEICSIFEGFFIVSFGSFFLILLDLNSPEVNFFSYLGWQGDL
jgi:hypothetical protein